MANEKFIITGGNPLNGTVEIRGAKNAALPILAAALLTQKPCVIANLPLIEDVFRMVNILEVLGAEISWLGERKIKIACKNINPAKLPPEIVKHFRGSILVLGPLLARFGKLVMPTPGGCIIGARPLDTHFDVFKQFGFKVSPKKKAFAFHKNSDFVQKKQANIVLQEFSVTATENALLFAANKFGRTSMHIADQDYQVQELCKVLKKMGAKIKGQGTHNLEISGAENLFGFSCSIISDPIETGTFIAAALATRGEVLIKNAQLFHLTLFLKKLSDFGAKFEILGPSLIKVLPSPKIRMDKIQSLPYPGINSDLQPELGVLATQTKGPTLIHDPLYEGRLKYLEELNKMGAKIIFCDPHRAIIEGPTTLEGIEIPSPDLRAGAALVIAGLVAKGQTIISNIYQIDRGYEKIEERLQKLGADIRRVKENCKP